MKKVTLQVTLTQKELIEMADRYHFDREALPQIEALYRAVLPLLRISAVYRLLSFADACACAGDTGMVFGHSPFAAVCACAVTLGEGIDRLQELYSGAGAVWEDYILECLGNTLLEKTYERLGVMIWQETGLYLNGYRFPGSDMPIEKEKDILQKLKKVTEAPGPKETTEVSEKVTEEDFPVTCSEVYTLRPKKSVVFLGILGEKKSGCGICDSCGRAECEYRKEMEARKDTGKAKQETCREDMQKKDEKAIGKPGNYSYGYQRIFGGGKEGDGK